MSSINDVVTKATGQCAEANRLVQDSNALLEGAANGNGVAFQREHRDLIVDRAFMNVFKALESYLESVFICYMMGEKGLNNNFVSRYVTPVNEEHAERLLRGKEQYIDFTNRSQIMKFAENFFRDGGPFGFLDSVAQDFEDMKKVRNEISHKSIKSRRDFERLVRSKMAEMPDNITVSEFLMTTKPHSRMSFFEHYVDTVNAVINKLANPD